MRQPVKQEEIATVMRNRLLSGFYPLGSRLPDERSLSSELGVSRKTLRVALGKLEAEGLLDRSPRLGTFVHPEHEAHVKYCYYILPCHDLLKFVSYPSAIGHTRLISGCCQACERRNAQCVMMPLSNDNNPKHLLQERLCNLPAGSRIILTGASWYQSMMPLFLSRGYRLVMYHSKPDCLGEALHNVLFIGFDRDAFVRQGLEFLHGLGCRRPLLVLDPQHDCDEARNLPVLHLTASSSRGLERIRKAFAKYGCDSLFCENFPRARALESIHELLGLPYDVQVLMNDNLMDYSNMLLPPHLIGFDTQQMASRGIDFLYSNSEGGTEWCGKLSIQPKHWMVHA